MRKFIATIAVLLSVCANAQYKETLRATIGPTNTVVTGIPDWAKSDTPPVGISSNEVADIAGDIADSMAKDIVLGNYVPFIEDKNGDKTAVVIGTLPGGSTYYGMIGTHSFAIGNSNLQEGKNTLSVGIRNRNYGAESFVSGNRNTTLSTGSIALGGGATVSSSDNYAFAWNGVYNTLSYGLYFSHGPGTYNINPVGGLSGFYIGENNLTTILSEYCNKQLNIIEITNGNDIVINPINRMANWVEFNIKEEPPSVVNSTIIVSIGYEMLDGDDYKYLTSEHTYYIESYGDEVFKSFEFISVSPYTGDFVDDDVSVLLIRTLEDSYGYGDPSIYNGEIDKIPAGTVIPFFIDGVFNSLNDWLEYISANSLDRIELNYAWDTSELDVFLGRIQKVVDGSWYNVGYAGTAYIDLETKTTSSPNISISIPNSEYGIQDFSIGFVAETDYDITWTGKNIFEAFPGASKAIAGTNIWTVSQYDSNSCVVSRTPFSIDSGLLTAEGNVNPEKVTAISNGTETRTADALFRSADNVNTIWSYVYGDTVWIAVTNYMRTVSGVSPSFQLWEVRDGKTNCVYWSAEEIDIRVGDKIDVAMSNIVNTVVTKKADRAWSKYQSMTGEDNPAPNDITIVSTPSIMLSGGYEWQRYVESANEVWVLKCNDLVTLGADTNAYFRITDLEGKTQFAIEKTASRLIDAVPYQTGFSGDYFEVTFNGNIKPTIYVSLDLANSAFIECTETENEYGLSCSWTQDASANTYKATIVHNPAEGKPSKMFVYGKVLQQGSTVVKHTAPSSFDGGIIINGIHYNVGTATINGNTVLTLTNGQAVNE